LIKKWSENEFKTEPALALIPTFYVSLKADGHEFQDPDDKVSKPKAKTVIPKDPNVVSSQQEEDDIAKAIALSLQEADKLPKSQASSSPLYPNFTPAPTSRELRKVRALYDFEAAEDNELTFKAGELITILDDSDPNWWKGATSREEGLFPSNFVTADLSVEPEPTKESKSVKFNEEVEVKTVEPIPEVVEIDEDKIDQCLAMLQNADPTGENTPDPPDMTSLEEQCKAMGPLIDQELEKVDRKHNGLMELDVKVVEALQMYHNLMKELPGYGYVKHLPGQPFPPQMPQQMYGGYPVPQGGMAGPPPASGAPTQNFSPPTQNFSPPPHHPSMGPAPQMANPPQMAPPPVSAAYSAPNSMPSSGGMNYAPPTSVSYSMAPHGGPPHVSEMQMDYQAQNHHSNANQMYANMPATNQAAVQPLL